MCSLEIILTSLYLVEGLAWWDWPFTWCTDQLLSFSALHCWLGHLTRKTVPDMTYNVFGGTLNPTLLRYYIWVNRLIHMGNFCKRREGKKERGKWIKIPKEEKDVRHLTHTLASF